MQPRLHAGLLGQLPGLVLVHILVDAVGQQHGLAQGLAEFSLFKQRGNGGQLGAQVGQQGFAIGGHGAQLTLKALADEASRARGDVDVLAHQVGVHPCHKIIGVEVDVFHPVVELGGDVVAQPFGVQAQRQILEGVDAGAPALAHLFATDGDEAVHKNVVGRLAAAEVQHRRPEQGVEVGDVFADEVVLLHFRVGHEFVVTAGLALGCRTAFGKVIFQRREVAHRRIQPDIKILARRIGNFNAEVGRIAADVPVAQATLAVVVLGEPLANFVGDFALQFAVLRPGLQVVDTARVGQLEEIVLRAFQHRRRARQGRVGVLQFGGRIHRAARLTAVAILVFGAALGALALDEAVRQEHGLVGVEKLLDGARLDQARRLEVFVDGLSQLMVFRPIGGMPVVKRDVKAIEVGFAARRNVGHKLLRRLAGLLRRNHDGRAMGIVGTHKMHLMPLHALVPHPNVGLDVLHDVTDVEIAIGVGQGGGDEQLALRHGKPILV